MLRSEFEYLIYSKDHVVQIGVRIRLSLPLMLSSSPVVTGKLSDPILPALEKPHAFVELNSYIGE